MNIWRLLKVAIYPWNPNLEPLLLPNYWFYCVYLYCRLFVSGHVSGRQNYNTIYFLNYINDKYDQKNEQIFEEIVGLTMPHWNQLIHYLLYVFFAWACSIILLWGFNVCLTMKHKHLSCSKCWTCFRYDTPRHLFDTSY